MQITSSYSANLCRFTYSFSLRNKEKSLGANCFWCWDFLFFFVFSFSNYLFSLWSLIVCHPVNMFRTSSCRVHRLRMLWKHCVVTAWRTPHCRLFSSQLLWYGFRTAVDRERLEEVNRRGKRSGLCRKDQSSVKELIDDADDSMFSQLMNNVNHALDQLIPPGYNTCYDLRSRYHDRLLTHKPNSIVESNFYRATPC